MFYLCHCCAIRNVVWNISQIHYSNVTMGALTSQITSLTIVYSTVYSGTEKKKTSKLRVSGLCVGNSPGPGDSQHKWLVTRKMFPLDEVIMIRVMRGPDCINAWFCMLYKQSGAVITRSNITYYYIQLYINTGRTWARTTSHKIHTIARLHGELWGIFCENLEKINAL